MTALHDVSLLLDRPVLLFAPSNNNRFHLEDHGADVELRATAALCAAPAMHSVHAAIVDVASGELVYAVPADGGSKVETNGGSRLEHGTARQLVHRHAMPCAHAQLSCTISSDTNKRAEPACVMDVQPDLGGLRSGLPSMLYLLGRRTQKWQPSVLQGAFDEADGRVSTLLVVYEPKLNFSDFCACDSP